ncbi:hypothetical protein [Phytohabitans aurantiacus]|uniref:Uncharacterized protein n=1 Tax=Phytohabitans aurantiacus TaxID=3016789 RepID=A0ABQ5QZC8_9ACTN|nr:hypothetical protein [Phytohabitans aurantiacus]GLH99918.1 hypothetical protein Pa4123_51940 [Phytohabitans aurantiacus]
MPVAAALGETLVSLDKLDEIAEESEGEVIDFVTREEVDETFSLPVGDNLNLGPAEFLQARVVHSPTNPYEGIGFGKPLTIVIEAIYVGDYPDALKWVPGFNVGDVLVTSANKAFHVFDSAPRSVHLLEPRTERRSFIKARASDQGSQLVYYSPAVDTMSILFSVELSSDRDLNSTLGESFAKALSTAGALPVFAPAAPYLVAAGAVIPIAMKAAQLLARPQMFFAEDVELNFQRPGVKLAQPGALVLYPHADESPFSERYKLGADFVLRDVESGEAYDGPLPYIVISLDGTEHTELKGWSAQAASAELLERFIQPDELISKTLDVVTESLALYNDMQYRHKAAEALDAAGKATGAEKKEEELAKYQAYVKNIQNKEIRKTIEKTEHEAPGTAGPKDDE